MDSFLKTLQHADFEVDHLTVSTQKHPLVTKAYPENIRVESVEIDTNIKPLQALKFLLKKGSYNVQRFHSKKVAARIEQMIKVNTYDFIILDSLYSTTYLSLIREIFKGRIYMRSHNCEAQIWFDLAKNEKNTPKSAYYKKLAKDLNTYEKEVIKSVDGVIAISHEDLEIFKSENSKAKICVIPVHLETPEHSGFKVQTHKVFHIGNMDWIPNREAVDRLLMLFKKAIIEDQTLTLTLAGKNSDKHYSALTGMNVEGFVNDLKSFAQNNGILVSPIASSSGVRIKILEMMAYGVPVITTTEGARGILPEGKKAIEIHDTEAELIKAILSTTTDEDKLAKMKTSAQNYIKKHHNIELIAADLKSFILD
jgi:glycosyltransferase involved in cell wall biosynthesis